MQARIALARQHRRRSYTRGARHLPYEPLQSLILMRVRDGISQEQVASMMGVSVESVRRMENYSDDVRLYDISSYALCVNARIRHYVTTPKTP